MDLFVSSYCRVTNSAVTINGRRTSFSDLNDPSQFLVTFYAQLKMTYPKFHKMDNLSKLGILATQGALNHKNFLEKYSPTQIAIVLGNKASSIITDKLHQKNITHADNYLPSPAVFVYTLPNIVLGEIAIKYGITGENAFFVSDTFDAQLFVKYNEMIFAENAAEASISGWVNYDGGKCDALICLIEKAEKVNLNPLNLSSIHQLYNQE